MANQYDTRMACRQLRNIDRSVRREILMEDMKDFADIYAAREQNTFGVSSSQLAERIPHASYQPDWDALLAYLRESSREGDLLLIMGAGDISRFAAEAKDFIAQSIEEVTRTKQHDPTTTTRFRAKCAELIRRMGPTAK